jgi:tetratricopeptide (TPR) repeat protein
MLKLATYIGVLGVVLLLSCSTEKNSFLSRTYHSTTARFNGYFNANELLDLSLATFYSTKKDDFYEIIPVNILPNEEESKGMHAAIDTAISKCSKVIKNHSMPSTEDMYYKDVEHNKWIDENWITIGRALYYKRQYQQAKKNFEFVKRLFEDDPSFYVAKLWIAKIHIEERQFADAKLILDDLNAISLEQKEKTFRDYIPFVKDKYEEDEEERPVMNRKLQYEIYKSYADLAIKRKEYPEAIEGLQSAIIKCPNAREKTRLHFILGQLYQEKGVLDSARLHYTKSLKSAAPFEIAFNARLNRAICGGGDRLSQDLKRMLKDAKNAPFKDQVYYALANLEINRGNKEIAKVYLTESAFYSNGNARQKAMSYEKLGDLSYAEKEYVSAQKYYDSCTRFIPEGYPNGDQIRDKAIKLSDLVTAIETVVFEDSVQQIALLDEDDREDFLKETLKQIKREAQKRKEMEAAKLLALQEQNNANSNNTNKSVFTNPKLREQGYEDFRKAWGSRDNEDHWRRSEKILFSNVTDFDSTAVDSLLTEEIGIDSLTIDDLRKNLPLTDSLFAASELKLLEALYQSGVLYKEILNESGLAEEQFNRVLEINQRNLTDLSSAFQLYKLNEATGKKEFYAQHILRHYPSSDAAKYLNDPDFYIKQKESEKQDEQAYLSLVELYYKKAYVQVIDSTDRIIEEDLSNAFRADYLLLNVFANGQIKENKEELVPLINRVIEEKPGTPQAEIAQSLLDILKNGFSKNDPVNFDPDYIYTYDDSEKHFLIVLLDEDDEVEDVQRAVNGFNNKKHKSKKLKVSSNLTMDKTSFVLVKEFDKIKSAQEYINSYKAGYEILDEYQDNKIYSIGIKNLKILIESSNFEEYNSFFIDFY